MPAEQTRPVRLGQGRGADGGLLGPRELRDRAGRLRLGEGHSRTVVGESLLQRGDRRESVGRLARARLGARELQPVVEVVGEEREERAVDLGGPRPLVAHAPVAALDQEAGFAREVGREVEGLLRFREGLGVVAEGRPGRRQGGVRQSVVRFGGDGPLEQVARRHLVVDAKPGEALGVEPGRFGARGQRSLDGGGVGRGDGGQVRASREAGLPRGWRARRSRTPCPFRRRRRSSRRRRCPAGGGRGGSGRRSRGRSRAGPGPRRCCGGRARASPSRACPRRRGRNPSSSA